MLVDMPWVFVRNPKSIKINSGRFKMGTYECAKCGMAVIATCAKSDAPLVDDILKLDDSREVQISKCLAY